MKSFKQFLNEGIKSNIATLALASSALAAPPKPEAMDYIVNFIKQKEGFREVAEPDRDAKGNPNVGGYGTTGVYPDTGKPVQVGDKFTQENAERLLRASIEKDIVPKMEKIPGWDDMQAGQQASILSLAYNVGPNFYGSKGYETITQNLKNKEWDKVPDTLLLYNKAGGKVLRGLQTRRQEEASLWKDGIPSKENNKQKPNSPTLPIPASSAVSSTTVSSKPQTVAPAPSSTEYTIRSGDTLSVIARNNKTTVEELARINNIKDPNKIQKGQKIKLSKS
jgi:lysozyme